MATIKLVHWSTTRFHPFNQHLAGEFMRTRPGGHLSMFPESSGVLPSKSYASGGIVVTVQHNLPCPRSPVMAIPVGVCIAPESVPVILRTREKMTTNTRIFLLPPLLQSQMGGSVDFPGSLFSKRFVSMRANWKSSWSSLTPGFSIAGSLIKQCLRIVKNSLHPIRRTTQIWVVICHQ